MKPSLSSHKRKVQEVFNRYIRLRDCLATTGTLYHGICISCDADKDIYDLDAGHFVSVIKSLTRFDERNVNAQCQRCNRYQKGSLDTYFVGLEKKYGRAVVDELIASKNKIKKWTIPELQELYKVYNEKLKNISPF